MSLLLGLDVGTGGARAVAVDESGRVVAEASSEYPLASPRPGWAEQNPEDWWESAKEALGKVASGVEGEILGLGLTGQMHGSVFLDDSGAVIRPALLWNDQRTEAQCREITEAVGEERLIGLAGNPALTGFQAPKIVWLRDEEPENYTRVSSILPPRTTSGSGSRASTPLTHLTPQARCSWMLKKETGRGRFLRLWRSRVSGRPKCTRDPRALARSARTLPGSWVCLQASRWQPEAGTTPRRRSGPAL